MSSSPSKISFFFFLGGGGGRAVTGSFFWPGGGRVRGEGRGEIPYEQRFLSACMAFSVYEVFHMACLSKHQLSDRQAKC